MIPLLDLKLANAPMQREIEEALARVARSGRYVLGPEVEAFEAEWADYCGVKHCVGTGNALEALQLVLMASGIGRGDEVIVPSNTYIATWLAVTHAGAKPVPVEPDPDTFNLDPLKIEAAITRRTRAIIPVHLYGQCADMATINGIARQKRLLVLEDAAQAHGARYMTLRAGGLADAAAFSFYPSKNLGALGDAGAVTTDDADLARRVRRMRNYGGVGRLDHTVIGINSRLDELQAAVLRAKLPYLNEMNAARRERAKQYRRTLGAAVELPAVDDRCEHVYHQFVVRHPKRDELVRLLGERGVEAHVHYPVPPHLEGAYCGKDFCPQPIAERLAGEVLSLPIGYGFDLERVAKEVRAAAGELRVRCVEGAVADA